jgi:predicted nucleic-acid-binding protein
LIGLDTNVIIRYTAQDDPVQSPKASALIESLDAGSPGFLSLTSVLEIFWVLSSLYGMQKPRMNAIVVEKTQTVWYALEIYKNTRADFEDCLIQCSGQAFGCDYTLTFDANAAKTTGMRLIR